jgi:hypothetical protein
MFARVLQWRRGYTDDECQVRDPGALGARAKRSSMQDLVDGQCPDIEKQVQTILSQPIREATNSSTGTGSGGNGSNTGVNSNSAVAVRSLYGTVVGVVAAVLLGQLLL